MTRVIHLVATLAALPLLCLGGCAPLQEDFAQPRKEEDRQVLEQMRTLQEQLKEVQEDLARLQTLEALKKGRRAETPAAWTPLTEAGNEPPGFGRYTYVLFRDRQRYDALLRALDALPARSDLPTAEANRFLLPLHSAADGSRPDWDAYDTELAAACLEALGEGVAGLRGPLLVSLNRPLGDDGVAALVVDLADTSDAFVAEMLAHYQRRVEPAAAGEPPQASLFWALLEQTGPAGATVGKRGTAVLLSWRP